MLRRMLSLMVAAALLFAAVPQAAFAVSAQEALFGNVSTEATATPAPTAVPEVEEAEAPAAETADTVVNYDGVDAYTQYRVLRVGDRDTADGVAYIVFLQNRLIELGYLHDAADGYYGENTQTAVRWFQKYNNLPETGVADPNTQTVLFSDISTLTRAPEDSAMFASDTLRVQTQLALWGFLGGPADGIYGRDTANAIRFFEDYIAARDPNYGVTPTPEPTSTPEPSTIFGEMPVALDELLIPEVEYTGEITAALLTYVDGDKPFQLYRQTVRLGDTGDEVKRVQSRLKALHYTYAADGSFGELTDLGLRYFQRKNGLQEDGIADETTQRLLFSTNAVEAEEYVFPYKCIVDISDQRVYVGKWTGEAYTEMVKTFVCSTGTVDTPTPLGTFQAEGKAGDEWYYFKEYACFARWGYRIVGGILFHSITYDMHKKKLMSESSLGRRGSHGCIRLKVADAKWIYDNCPAGTTVVIRE